MKQSRIPLVPVLWVVLLSVWAMFARGGHAIEPPRRESLATPQARLREAIEPASLPAGLGTKVEPSLLKRMLEGEPGETHRFIVEMAQQADLAALPNGVSRADGRHLIVAELQATARQSQAEVLTLLLGRQARGQVQQVRSFWVFNGLAVTGDAETLLALAAHPQVHMIREDHWRQWIDPSTLDTGELRSSETDVEWNIGQVRADLAWSSLGLDGNGVTVAILDSGVDWQHPALRAQYRGYKPGGLAIHEGNWLCTTDEGYLYPVDGSGHGTHVAGIAVGGQDPAGQAIGVAPGARWIAAKMLNDAGYGYDSWIHAAFEWVMAPNDDPSLAPDVVNGSWGSRAARDETLRPDLQALRAAGIAPIFSIGNEGPYASTLRSPASLPEAIAVGATDDLDQVTSFSSRGPSPWGEIKPELVAPGVQIRSSLPGGTYGGRNGTSMAAPHVTGLVALMLQADSTLTVDDIEEILTSSALPLGENIPNNATGWGRIDAYQAAAVAMEAGFVVGRVTRHPDQQPLATAQVTAYDRVSEPRGTVQVDDTGHYHLALPPGRYNLVAKAFGYEPETASDVVVQGALTASLDMELRLSPTGVLWGQVTNADTGGPVSAQISIDDAPALTTSDPQTGQYSMPLPAGTYALQVRQNGYRSHKEHEVLIGIDQDTRLDVALAPAPTLLLIDSGGWYYGSQASYFEQALDDRDYVYDLWEIRDLETDLPDLSELAPYKITIWSSPLDAPGLVGAGDTISDYMSMGGNLFLTGQDVGYWDGGLSIYYWHDYYGRFLKAEALADNAGRDNVVGVVNQILEGLSLPINGPDSAGNQETPDVVMLIDPREGAIVGRYQNDGEAGLQASECQSFRTAYLAAGLEGLGNRDSRAEVMERSLTWLANPSPMVEAELHPPEQDKVWLEGTSITYTVELKNRGESTDRFALELSPSVWPSSVWDGTFTQVITQSMVLNPCQTQTLGLEVTVPSYIRWNLTDVVTLTARSMADASRAAQATFHSKASAPILLVDDHVWHDTLADYQAALEAHGLPYNVWITNPPSLPRTQSPSLQRLRNYPVVIWFTAYDWHETLAPSEEERLAAYLEGGGRLLLSSQDYLYTSGFPDFARDYLGVVGYTEGLTVTRVTGAVSGPFNQGQGPYDLVYPFRNWSDALQAGPDTSLVFWGQHGQPAALAKQQAPWKTAFFAFPLEALNPQDMATVLGDAVEWLSPLGDSTLVVDAPVAAQGETLSYTLHIQNTGPRPLTNVSLSNTLPLSATYLPGSLSGPASYDPATRRIVWSDALAVGEAVNVSYRVQLEAGLPIGAKISNKAHLTDESGLGPQQTASTRIDAPNLATSVKTASLQVGAPGEILTYTVSLHNDGLRPAQAHLVDPVPANAIYLPGSGWASSGQLTLTAETVAWSGSIPEGQVVSITFPAVISTSLAGRYVYNRAILDDGWGDRYPLETYTWVEARLFLPLILKQP